MTDLLSIGIDLGATKIAAALATSGGETLAALSTPTLPGRGAEAVLDDIASLVLKLAANYPIVGIGVGSPGRCDPVDGVVYGAVNLGWDEVPMVSELNLRLSGQWPVFLQNDAKASALGEYYFGAAQGCGDFILFTIGSGLGGGVMVGDRLVTGANFNPAEVGHISLDPLHGRRCACGLRGCAETVVSGPGLVAVAVEMLGEKVEPSLLKAGNLQPSAVLEAARQGDRLALRALTKVTSWLGQVAAAGLALLNPARLIIGGGLGIAAFDLMLPTLKEELVQRVLPARHEMLKIVPSRLDSSALGAASMVWYGLGISTQREEVSQRKL